MWKFGSILLLAANLAAICFQADIYIPWKPILCLIVVLGAWWWIFRRDTGDVESMLLGDVDAREITTFQRWCLGEFRAKRGVPKLTQANQVMVQREMYAIVREARHDVRGIDLNYQVARLTTLAFIPSDVDVQFSLILNPDYSVAGWIDWLFGTGHNLVRTRIDSLRRPSN